MRLGKKFLCKNFEKYSDICIYWQRWLLKGDTIGHRYILQTSPQGNEYVNLGTWCVTFHKIQEEDLSIYFLICYICIFIFPLGIQGSTQSSSNSSLHNSPVNKSGWEKITAQSHPMTFHCWRWRRWINLGLSVSTMIIVLDWVSKASALLIEYVLLTIMYNVWLHFMK